jgi:hypothetical protein
MLKMERLCVACAIECIIVAILEPNLLKLEFMVVVTKALPFGVQRSLVPFLDKLVLVLALKMIEISLSSTSGFYFSNIINLL